MSHKISCQKCQKCQVFQFKEDLCDDKLCSQYSKCGRSEDFIQEINKSKPDRKLIDDYMWKIKQNISCHTATEGVIAIKYYLVQIYEQIYVERRADERFN